MSDLIRQKVADIIWDWSTADMLTSDWLLECADAVIAIARPAGYAIVPIEPTKEMIRAMNLQTEDHVGYEALAEMWRAALAVVPTSSASE